MMVRRTTLATALLGIFAGQAFALGLGDIRIKSHLDQPLDAEIEVLSSSPQELASLRVMLAPPEAYERAGIERAFFHSKLRFRIEKRPDGRTVIRVTSKDPVKEPFLDFLVEANWGAGQIIREYTLLVDPPTLVQAPAPRVQAPAATVGPTPPATAAPPRIVSAPASVSPPPRSAAPGTYGPTQRNETLWKIAERVRPSRDVTIQQVMLAILEANPEAFYNANINNLKAGYVLRIPSLDEIRSIDRAEAAREFRRQMAEWRSGAARPGASGGGAARQVAASPAPAESAGTAAAPAQPRLKLVAPDDSTASGEGGSAAGDAAVAGSDKETIARLKEELTLANEAIEAQEQQNAQLNERLRRLEEQVEKLHRLLELKDSELARLQQQSTAPSVPDAGVDTVPAMPEGTIEAEASAAGPEGGVEARPAQPEEPAPEGRAAEGGEQTPTAAMEEEILPEEEMGNAPAGWLDRLLTDPLYQGVGGGILLFLLLLLWMARRNRDREGPFEESILQERSTPVSESVQSAPVESASRDEAGSAEPATADAGPQTDSSLFTDFAVSGMDAMREEAEADPLAEADVYLAYGRYQQAEELIRSVIEKEPDNLDLYVKLLEVLYAARNQAAFDAEAEALLARLENPDDPRWQRVAEMGQELSPGNPLYRQDAEEAAAEAEPAPAPEAAPTTAPVSEPGGPAEPASEASEDEGVIEFETEAQAAREPASAADAGLESDLTSADVSGQQAALPEGEGALAPLDEVATKLDLARAYMEMGDPEGARSILQEVLEEGSREQKEEAETLLREVG